MSLFMKFEQRLIKYHAINSTMKTSHRNLAMVLMGIVALSTSGVYSLTHTQTPTSAGITEQPTMLGHIEAVVKDKNGNIIAYRQSDNQVMTDGKNATTNILFFKSGGQNTYAPTGTKFQWVGVGTTNTATNYTQSRLAAQLGGKLNGTVTAINSGGGIGMGAQIAATWPAGRLANASQTSSTVTEAGLFDSWNNATASSNMYARQVISPGISMGTGDTLTVTWKITFN